jgi:hypothetical protein
LNPATLCPARRNAAINPTATVVLPALDDGAAITTRGIIRPHHSAALRQQNQLRWDTQVLAPG